MNNDTHTTQRSEVKPSVTVIGMGAMGSAIASRLLGNGFSVGVWNRTPQRAQALTEIGATAFDDVREAVEAAEVILTLLPTAETVTELMIGRGLIDAVTRRAVWAQMGTVGVEATESLDTEVRGRRPDVAFVDAPLSGSRHQAEVGELLVLASGPEPAQATLTPLFDAIGRETLWLGAAGMGSRMKLVLNTWLAFEVEAAAEATALARRLGIDSGALGRAVRGNPLASPLAVAKLAKMNSEDDQAEFSLEWALKDLDLVREATHPNDAPVAIAIAERWRTLVDQGLGAFDVSAARHGLGDQPTVETGESRRSSTNGTAV